MSQGGILNYVASTPAIPTSFSTDAGTAIPIANLLQVLGGEGIDTSAAGNIVTITGEIATAGATLPLSNLGIAAFNSSDFTVVNGFVSIAATFGGFQSIMTDSGPPAVVPDGTGLVTFIGGANITTTGGVNSVTFDVTGIVTNINGDVGAVSGNPVSILGNTSLADCGATVSFIAGGPTELDFNVTDANGNTIIGQTAGGNISTSGISAGSTALGGFALFSVNAVGGSDGSNNTSIGFGSMFSLTTGWNNIAIGNSVLAGLLIGTHNIVIGNSSGLSYANDEGSNILINHAGVAAEDNTIRIGTDGTGDQLQNRCFIAGISGVATANSATVTIDTTTGQLGSLASLTVPLGGTGVNSITDHALIVGSGTAAITEIGPLTNGQLVIGNTGNDPSAATLTAGAGIGITNAAGSITIATIGGGLSWSAIGASQNLVINNGYICTAGGALALALPAVSAVGTVIGVALDGSGSFSITQGAGQQIRLGSVTTTLGAGGSLTTTAQGDSLMMVCKVANTLWTIYHVLGNFTVV